MNSSENLKSQEDQDNKAPTQDKHQVPFNPIEQRIEGCFDLINSEYNKKFGTSLPDNIKALLLAAISGKNQKTRDEILDDIIYTIQIGNDVELNLVNYLKMIPNSFSEQSHEQEKTDRNLDQSTRNKAISELRQSVLSLDGEGKAYADLLQRLKALNTIGLDSNLEAEITSILAELENPEILLAVSLDLQEQDRRNGTHTYETFRSSVIALEPSFKDKFPEADTRAMLALGTDTLKNTHCSGNILKALTDDGFILKAPLDATRRTISQYGSEYALSSDIEAKAAQKRAERITSKLKEKMKPLETHLSNIKKIRERLELAKSQGIDFEQLQREFQTLYPELYVEYGLDRATSFEEMLRFVHSREILLLERMDELEEDAQKAKGQIIAELKSRAEQKDVIKKEILKFFRLIGFDMFSKAETDAVFKWLNNNPDILASLGASAPFDIENGVFGYRGAFADSEELPIQGKRVFAGAFNKMLTGSVEYPVCFDEMGNCVFYESVENFEKKRVSTMFDMKNFGNQMLGGGDRVLRMIGNLRRDEQE